MNGLTRIGRERGSFGSIYWRSSKGGEVDVQQPKGGAGINKHTGVHGIGYGGVIMVMITIDLRKKKLEAMNEWLDRLQTHHEKEHAQKRDIANGPDRPNIADNLYADAMKHVRSYLDNRGWDETKRHLNEWVQRTEGTNRVGPHHLNNCYKQILDKMQSIEKKFSKGKL